MARYSKHLIEAMEAEDGEAILNALTERQRLFCYEYIKDLNASKAATRAGYETAYPEKIGNQLKQHPGVRAALLYLQKDRLDKMNLDASFVVDKIIKSIGRSEAKGNEATVLKGLEMLGKHIGMFIDRQEISGPGGEAIHVKEEQIRQQSEEFKNKILSLSRKGANPLKLVKPEENE